MKKFLTIIIPAYNCEKFLPRLLNSIKNQDIPQEEIQIILVDDKSTDNTVKVAEEADMGIEIVTTEREVHCPGNTRAIGLKYAIGDWITFIDNDDMFEKNVFGFIKNTIQVAGYENEAVLATNFRSWNEETQEYFREFKGEKTDTWHHGKFYNRKRLIEMGAHFKEDLKSHEDLYFNNYILGNLIAKGEDYRYINAFTYKWVHNPNSLSRSYFNKKHFYIETYLKDYLDSCSNGYFDLAEKYPEQKSWYLHQILMAFLHGYFYYNAELYRFVDGDEDECMIQNKKDLIELGKKIIDKFDLHKGYIYRYFYYDIEFYEKIKKDCFTGTNPFIEVISLHDFVKNNL